DHYFQELRTTLAWQQDRFPLAGKYVPLPRLQVLYGDRGCDYDYSGIAMTALPWPPLLAQLRAQIQQITGHEFRIVVANCYRDGADSVGWHADNESGMGPQPAIASLSLGATRRFSLKHKFRRDLPRLDLDLISGSLLLMAGRCQDCWLHRVPKTKRPVGERINLTFRPWTAARS
ncbi:MAG: alpha-ketoglutarate-dependent dioxygenase AlkB, partial [Oscillatoriales cyanobacterium RM2_1_1]|nr:alpha-ketoglutarate-dependent dioxygenase AlkB [Oscillatoriales cyanobacterium RM2_1_1]